MAAQTVTVAIPFAGGSIKYLSRALESLTIQDFSDWHAVVVDDTPGGCSDAVSLVRGRGGSQLTYLRNEGSHGIGSAWNVCMDAVRCELFCLLHADDELESTYLSTMVGLARTYPDASLYFCGARIIDEDGRECFSLPDRAKDFIRMRDEPIVLSGPSAIERLVIGNFIMCPTSMYRRSRIDGLRFSEQHRFVLDFRFNLGILFDGGLIVGTQRKAYRYRRHRGQATARLSSTGDRFAEELELFQEIGERATRRGWHGVANAARTRPVFRIHAALARKWKYVLA
jgi:glycosyltransferase involved in cell wall biosynthesis